MFTRNGSGQQGSEDKEGRVDLEDHFEEEDEEDEENNKDAGGLSLSSLKMKDFSLFADRAKNSEIGSSQNFVGADVLVYMHFLLKSNPSMVPYFVRTLPDGMGRSKGAGSDSRQRVRRAATTRAKRSSDHIIDLTGVQAALQPSAEEKASHRASEANHRASEMSHNLSNLREIQALRSNLNDSLYNGSPENRRRMLDYIQNMEEKLFKSTL
ncbi:MAG: hypothetical protein ACREOZ_05080 [Gloeomargaritales cyanobacterium]